MSFSMSVREFFDARDNALRQCNPNEFLRDFGRNTPRVPEHNPCRASVLDLSNRMIYGVGLGKRTSQRKKNTEKSMQEGRVLDFLDPSVDFNDKISFSGLDLVKASIITNGKVCGKFKRDLKQSFDKLKYDKIENHNQCLKGIDNLKHEFEMFTHAEMQSQ